MMSKFARVLADSRDKRGAPQRDYARNLQATASMSAYRENHIGAEVPCPRPSPGRSLHSAELSLRHGASRRQILRWELQRWSRGFQDSRSSSVRQSFFLPHDRKWSLFTEALSRRPEAMDLIGGEVAANAVLAT
jgi:hypothetical protein